jgi:hypothetical protein
MEENSDASNLVPITGLWLNETKSGKTYFSGYFGNAKVLIFKNTKKEKGSKQPDYNMCITKKKKKEDGDSDVQLDENVPF